MLVRLMYSHAGTQTCTRTPGIVRVGAHGPARCGTARTTIMPWRLVRAEFRVSERSMAVRTSASDEKNGSSDGATPLVRRGRCIHTAVHTHLERTHSTYCERIMVMM